jgi:Protein of unknown function (DUF2695)
MTESSLVEDTERELRALSARLTTPAEGECLLCFVHRLLDLGCNNKLRWACRYRDLRAPRATGLERRLGRVGGFCDCEIFLNGYQLAPDLWVRPAPYVEDGIEYLQDPHYPDPMPACRGVRRGSSQGCGLWVRIRRGW